MIPHSLPFASLFGALLLVSGCAADPQPLLTVDLRSDFTAEVDFSSVRTEVVVREGGGLQRFDMVVERGVRMLDPALRVAQVNHGLLVGTDYEVTVALLDASEAVVASQVRRLNVRDPNHGLTFVLTRACASVTCGAGEICVGDGACVEEDSGCTSSDPDACAEAPSACVTAADCEPSVAFCEAVQCRAGQCYRPDDAEMCGEGYCVRNGAESFCRDFETPVLTQPVARGPANGQMVGSALVQDTRGLGGRPKLLWNGSPGATYDMQLAPCASEDLACFDSPLREQTGIGDSFYYVVDPIPAAHYVWRVRACNADGCTDWSDMRTFWVFDRNDIDDDGYAELLVGAPSLMPDEGGALHSFGLGAREDQGMLEDEWTGPGSLGASVTSGDLTGDGRAEAVAGAPFFNPPTGGTHIGYVRVYTEDREIEIVPPTPIEEGLFGASLAWLPDVTYDGVGDLAIGQPAPLGIGRVTVIPGGTDLGDAVEIVGVGTGDEFGFAVEGCNIGGRARTELIVGAPGRAGGGAVYIYSDVVADAAPIAVVQPPAGATRFGEALRCVPDLDQDGNPDLLIGAPGGRGEVFLIAGGGWDTTSLPRLIALGVTDSGEADDRFDGWGSALGAFQNEDGPPTLLIGTNDKFEMGGPDGFALTLTSADYWTEAESDAGYVLAQPAVGEIVGSRGLCITTIGLTHSGGPNFTPVFGDPDGESVPQVTAFPGLGEAFQIINESGLGTPFTGTFGYACR